MQAFDTFTSTHRPPSPLLTLPTELRLAILEYAFQRPPLDTRFNHDSHPAGLSLNETHTNLTHLPLLLICRQLHLDGQTLALTTTPYLISNLFTPIPHRLSLLPVHHLTSLRSIAFVADSRHFRQLLEWRSSPFDTPGLNLNDLTIILHRSTSWHYLFDFTAGIASLLRRLQSVRSLTIVRNHARVKGSLKTWYNRLVGLIMKIDHHERYEKSPPVLEKTWWEWRFDDGEQRIVLEAGEARGWEKDEGVYLEGMRGLVEELRVSVEGEEWNSDPRSRFMYY